MKSSHPKIRRRWAAVFSLVTCVATAEAVTLRVTITNLAAPGGLHFTPVFAGFHDGGFDSFNAGAPASAALEALAEDGNNGPMLGDFLATSGRLGANITGVNGLGPGIFTPGHSTSFEFSGVDAGAHRYFSYASMLLPSNDAFFGNANPLGREIFDASGTFLGADFVILGSMLWDAGTEENDTLGAPFSTIGGTSTATIGGTVLAHPGLDAFVGSVLGNGVTLTSAFGPDTPVARIQISQVPEPGGLWLSLIAMTGLMIVRRAPARRRTSTNR
jgi:hypothetical protein